MGDLQSTGQKALAKVPQPLRRALGDIGVQFRGENGPVSAMAGGIGPGNKSVLAGVEQGSPNTISVLDPQSFAKAPEQLATHEGMHLWQNNLPPSLQKAIPADNPSDPYNYGGTGRIAKLVNSGGSILDLPKEQQSAAMQYGQANGMPEPYRKLAQTINDVPLSTVEMTDPMAKNINMHPRTPQVPPNTVPGMNFAKEIYQPGQPAPGDPLPIDPGTMPELGAPTAPVAAYAPDPLQQNIDRQQQQLQKIDFAQKNPWGTANNHPGTLGKIAHVLSVAGNIAGDIVAPNVMENIPGTQLNRQVQGNRLTSELNDETQEQSQNKSRDASTASTLASTAAEPQAAADRHALSAATTAHYGAEDTASAAATATPSLATAYAHAVQDALKNGRDPSQDPIVQHMADAITSIQKQPADPKTSHDDAYIKNLVQDNIAKGMSPHQAEEAAYRQFTKETKIDPGVQRASIALQMPTAIADPNNPGGVIYATRKGAIGQEAPSGIDTKVPLATAQDFSHGKDATTLTNINTADAHIAQLRKIGDALHNGNVQVANQLGNAYAAQTGSAAPLNFQLLKTALAAELAKTTSGGVATVEETKELTKALNSSNSPEQLLGVTEQAHNLMQSKKNVLHQQYNQGMHGKPNFDSAHEGESREPSRPANVPEGYHYDANGPKGKGWYK